ncbi:MAG TPA: L-2-hydroxyglutarate oxidase [Longimicrobiales bacterium]
MAGGTGTEPAAGRGFGRMAQRATTDFLVIGGGVIGLSLALEARRRFPDARVTLIEKEAACGQHASGRNSGVLHAGFYYTADSLKARLCREGNRELAAYCEERGLRLVRCGKLVVARSEADQPAMDELLRRARVNGVELHEVDEAEASRLEPRARTCGRALYSPSTAAVDPAEVVGAMVRDATQSGVDVRVRTAYLGLANGEVRTTGGRIAAGYVINAGGLHADRIARDFGFSADHRILPFKGLYLYAELGEGWLRRHIYPVPELKYPFLGVHFTVTVQGRVKIGPTAIPALWREQYGGLRNFRLGEFLEIGRLAANVYAGNAFEFRNLARRELEKRSRRRLLELASELVRGPVPGRWRWGTPGIRAQLVNIRERKLETDFRCEGDERSFHVLNAVSPAFTCAFPFARYVLDRIEEQLGHATPSPGSAAGQLV